MNNQKDAAISFLNLVTTGKVREAYEKHVTPEFRHHHPYCKGDRQSLQVAMEESEGQFPNKVFKIQRAIAEGDMVAVHSRVTLKAGEIDLAVVHIFRFQGSKIIEFWDIGQPIPKEISNENGMF